MHNVCIYYSCGHRLDHEKAKNNLKKHGIRFSDAGIILSDPNALTREDINTEGEPRPKVRERVMKKEYDFSEAKRGTVVPQKGKTRISIYIDNDILEEFRIRADRSGRGYQTKMNEALREYLSKSNHPLDEKTLRRVLREELKTVG